MHWLTPLCIPRKHTDTYTDSQTAVFQSGHPPTSSLSRTHTQPLALGSLDIHSPYLLSLSPHTHTDSDKCIAQSGFPPTLALSLTHSLTFTSRHTERSLTYLLLPLFRSSYTHVQHTEIIINKVIQLQKLLFLWYERLIVIPCTLKCWCNYIELLGNTLNQRSTAHYRLISELESQVIRGIPRER